MFFFFSSRRRHTRYWRDWSSDVCSSDLLQRLGGKRFREEKSLGKIAAHLVEQRLLLLDLHPFGHHFHPKDMRQIDDRLHNGRVLHFYAEPPREGLVYLEDVRWQALQVRERRVARTEVVHRD